jgi:hypothetical protein
LGVPNQLRLAMAPAVPEVPDHPCLFRQHVGKGFIFIFF